MLFTSRHPRNIVFLPYPLSLGIASLETAVFSLNGAYFSFVCAGRLKGRVLLERSLLQDGKVAEPIPLQQAKEVGTDEVWGREFGARASHDRRSPMARIISALPWHEASARSLSVAHTSLGIPKSIFPGLQGMWR